MSSAKPFTVVRGGQPAMQRRQTSLPKVFEKAAPVGGRGRAGRRVADRAVLPRPRSLQVADVTRAAAIDRWIDLIARHCGSREACAAMFGVTFQTACNWFDGVSAPSAAAVFQAVDWWGADLAAPKRGAA